MNWKLLFALSLFGLAMALATISLIPQNVEPFFWVVIFLLTAWLIARYANGRYFLHGLLLGLANCVWITGAHVFWFASYMASHPGMASMGKNTFLADHPRRAMVVFGPIVGIASGIVIGLIALLFSVLMKKKADPAAA
jgi:hypothetical protein